MRYASVDDDDRIQEELNESFPYKVVLSDLWRESFEWGKEQFGSPYVDFGPRQTPKQYWVIEETAKWAMWNDTAYFLSERDAMLFKLTWG